MASVAPLTVENMAEMRALPVSTDATVLVIANVVLGDNGGGFYRWHPTSTMTPDRFMNAALSDLSSTGRWLRVFQRSRSLPGGVLVMTGGVKSFYASAVTDGNGQVTVNLTEDGTATGTPLFTEVWLTTGEAQRNSTGSGDTISGNRMDLSSDLRRLKYQFSVTQQTKLAAALIGILGQVIAPLAPVAAGTPVTIRVDGV